MTDLLATVQEIETRIAKEERESVAEFLPSHFGETLWLCQEVRRLLQENERSPSSGLNTVDGLCRFEPVSRASSERSRWFSRACAIAGASAENRPTVAQLLDAPIEDTVPLAEAMQQIRDELTGPREPLTREQAISVLGMTMTAAKETAARMQCFDLAASLRDAERLFAEQHWQEVLAAIPIDFVRGALAVGLTGSREPSMIEQRGPGDCWTACIASLTGIPLEEFPVPPDVRSRETEVGYG